MQDPKKWPTELTRRLTSRLAYLETQAAKIYAEHEPDPNKRKSSYVSMMGANAYVLQSATYKYPAFTFAPSTAPDEWFWRYVIPYEMDIFNVQWFLTLGVTDPPGAIYRLTG